MKMIRFIRNDSPVIRIKKKERQQSKNHRGRVKPRLVALTPKKWCVVMGKVTTIRAKIAGMRVE